MTSLGKHHDKTFPGESSDYRQRRNALLEAEKELRQQTHNVTRLRQSLPQGGRVETDYTFAKMRDGKSTTVTLPELFAEGKNELVVYGFMYGPDWEKPCRSCTSIVDGLNGAAQHLNDRINLVVVAKAPIAVLQAWADIRDWTNLQFLSSFANSFNADYHAERADGFQIPALNVFEKTTDGIFHSYNTELLYTESDEGQEPRHVDSIWPIWNMLDMTRRGRGENWEPALAYEN